MVFPIFYHTEVVSTCFGHITHFAFVFLKQLLCLFDFLLVHVFGKGAAGVTGKELAEIIGTDVEQVGGGVEVDFFLYVCPDVGMDLFDEFQLVVFFP